MGQARTADSERRILYPLTASIVLAYFLFFIWKSLFLHAGVFGCEVYNDLERLSPPPAGYRNRSPAWVAMIIVAALWAGRSCRGRRRLLYAWVVNVLGLLPVSFSPARGGFAIYISYIGWALYAAVLLVALQDLATRHSAQYRTALACAVFVLVGWRYGKFNLHDQRAGPRRWLYDGPAQVRGMAGQMRRLHETLRANARILFLDDAFTTGEWTPLFIVQLVYRDPRLNVDRLKIMSAKPANWDAYQYVFTWDGNRYRDARRGADN